MQNHFFNHYLEFDPFLPDAEARSLTQLCEDFGSYGMYSEEGLNDGIGEGLRMAPFGEYGFGLSRIRRGLVRELLLAKYSLNLRVNTYVFGFWMFRL